MLSKSGIGVTHVVDGTNTWKIGLSGFFKRLRGVYFSIGLSIFLTTGPPFWWPNNWKTLIPSTITLNTSYVLWASVFLLTLTIAATLYYIRRRTQRLHLMSLKLHDLAHESRDYLCDLMRQTHVDPDVVGEIFEKTLFKHVSDKLCESIASYYRELIRDQSIGCAIRLGVVDASIANGEMVYVTVGRSTNMSKSRDATSKPIPRSQGIPHFFESEDRACQGALYYDDIDKAAASKAYTKTVNDEKFKHEIVSMVVVPINGWNGTKTDLIGLLYITSKTKKALNIRYLDYMKFGGDFVASIFTCIVSRLNSVRNSQSGLYHTKDGNDGSY